MGDLATLGSDALGLDGSGTDASPDAFGSDGCFGPSGLGRSSAAPPVTRGVGTLTTD